MLAANFDEVANLAVWVFDAGAAVSNVDEDALGCFVVFAFDGPTDTEHEVGGLLLGVVVEDQLLLFVHVGYLLGSFEGDQAVGHH